jgi:glycosyltransferase involved in cell wall biosynthesis
MSSKISVVVPAYNEEALLPACLDSLAAQKTKYDYEVLVVDNNSTDDTNKIAKSYQDKMNIKVILEKKKGRGVARHTGFSKAKGQIILSTDADTIVPHNWIEKIIVPLVNDQVVAVTGPCQTDDLEWLQKNIFNFFQPFSMYLYRLLMHHYWLSGFNFAIRKDVYEQCGGFDTNLNAQEDIELGFRVMKLGKIIFLRDLSVNFSGRRFEDGFWEGFSQYLQTFFKFLILKDKGIVLKDVRD